MWRYLSNVEPPRKKAKSGKNQSAERFKQYDKQTRQRKFQSAWKKDDQGREQEWLVFDDEMESMFCSAFRTFAKTDQDKKGPFVVGTNKFKLENIKAHELSKSHIFFKNLLWQPKQTCHWHTGRRVRAATHVSSTRKGDKTNEERACRGEALCMCPIHSLWIDVQVGWLTPAVCSLYLSLSVTITSLSLSFFQSHTLLSLSKNLIYLKKRNEPWIFKLVV